MSTLIYRLSGNFSTDVRLNYSFCILAIITLFAASVFADSKNITIENEGWILQGDRYNARGGAPKAVALLFHNVGPNRAVYTRRKRAAFFRSAI